MNIDRHVSLNLNIRGLEESPTLALNERSNELSKQGIEVYNMTIGQSPFPVPTPVVDALKHHADKGKYMPVKGLPELRKEVAEYHRNKDGVEDVAENVLIGPGSKQLMFMLLLVYYGEIIVPSPCWVSYIPQAQIIGRNVRIVNTTFEDHWNMTAERLRELLESEHDAYRPRILVLNYPGNPDGLTYTVEELKEIAEVARQYEVVLLSDEIYGQLHHKGEHISVARFYPEGTIISSGMSKWCSAGGYRLGTFTFPDDLTWLMEGMAKAASQTYTSVSGPIQYAAIRAFQGGLSIERTLWHTRRIYATVANECAQILTDAGVKLHPPEGAFYLFPDFSPFADKLRDKKGIEGSTDLCESLLKEKHVAIIPGDAFARPPTELTARISYCNFDGGKALAASENIALHEDLPDDFTEKYCIKTINGVKRIVEWLSEVD
ncbi:MAG: aspartate aminotransferase [Candidatus Proteinoplasmatales archaeon SG8-5]|nr:MAG: aspartate aminotransferase [Candidatus Proteinoplasmatales archaeon SG8-5]